MTLGNTQTSPTTRYAHNALGQRVFKTEPLYEDIAEEPGDRIRGHILLDDVPLNR